MFTRLVLPILVFSVLIAAGYWGVLFVKKNRVRQRLVKHLRFLEQRYLEFVNDREILADIRHESDSSLAEALVKDSMPILKPEIDALLDQLDQVNQTLLPESLDSDIFPNVLAAYRSLWTDKAGSSMLTSQERHLFRESLAEAVRADVHRRLLLQQTNS